MSAVAIKPSSSKRVVLFFPKTREKSRLTPPLPLLSIAAPLLELGYHVSIIDARIEKDCEAKVLEETEKALCLGMSVLTGFPIKDALKVSKLVKEAFPSLPIVWGGWHPSILPEQTASHPNVDFVVRGQGERTFAGLVERLYSRASWEGLAGLSYKSNGSVAHGPERPMEDLNRFPPAPYHLVSLREYDGRPTDPSGVFTSYISSQGCPFRCAFCADSLVFHRKWKALSAERVLDDLQKLQETYEVTEVLFADDNFFVNMNRVRSICRGIIDRKLSLKWQTTVRTHTVASMSDEDLELIKRSGCDLLHPGVEAPTQELLDYILKDERLEDTFICAEKLSHHHLRALYSFIVCFPGEPDTAISETFKIIKRLKEIDPNNIMPVNFYTPYPGNVLYEKSIEHGFREPGSLDKWGEFDTRIGSVPWITEKARDEVMKKDKYYFPAAFPSETLRRKMAKGKTKYLYRLFHLIARFRVNHDWYSIDLDWKLLLKYWRFWEKYRNKLSLHDIHFRW